MKVVASCTIQGDTFVIAPPGQLFAEVGLSDGLNEDTDAGLLSSALVEISCGFASTNFLSPLHTGDKVEFNTVNFVESRQSQLCGFGPVHTGNRVDCVALAPYTLAIESTVWLWPRTHWQQSRPYRQQSPPRQAVEFTSLPICCQNQQQS